MGGGSTPKVQEIKQTTSTLPTYAEPYVTDIMRQAQGLTSPQNGPADVYGQNRIAGFNQNQLNTQNAVMGLQAPGQYGTASDLATTAGIGSLVNSQYDPSQFNAAKATAGQVSGLTMATPQEFNQAMADKYMSPYTQSVLDIQRREAIKIAQQQQLAQDLGAARQGAYGGSRQLIAALGRERYLGQNLSDIQAKGMQSAYENAQNQFERDRAARMMAEGKTLDAGMQARLANAQYATQVSLADAQAQMDAQRMAEQSKQFGATQGLAGLAQANQSAQTLGNLGQLEQNATLANLQAQANVGQQQQQLEQQGLSQDYQDFLTQQAYPYEQLSYYNNIIRGLPISPGATTTMYGKDPSVGAQVVGAGLSALGAYKTATGG